LTDYRISDSIWLDQGSLAVAAGAQLYVFDKRIQNLDIRGQQEVDAHCYQAKTIFDICQRLNGPLPVYHPQFLQQAILAGLFLASEIHLPLGKLQLVRDLLEKLERILRDKVSSETVKSRLGDTLEIDTFLDTPLIEFFTKGQVRLHVQKQH
jgi:RAVE protein 1 C terminal